MTTHNINEPNLARCIFSRDGGTILGHGDACGHNGQFHDIKVWGTRFKYLGKKEEVKFMFNYYECTFITQRLCHIIWSRKMT